MSHLYTKAVVTLFALCTRLAAQAPWAPVGWHHAGSHPADYEMGCDTTIVHGGKKSGYLKCIEPDPKGFGSLSQAIKADHYRGKRVRLSGYARAQDVTGWAGFWMRVDDVNSKVLSFDNMSRRQIKGTNGWKNFEVVLDVPESSDTIFFGLILGGGGQVWIDDLKLEAVSPEVETTDKFKAPPLPTKPKLGVP